MKNANIVDAYLDNKDAGLKDAQERARRVAKKSITSEVQRVWGSFYRGDYITREQIASFAKYATGVLAALMVAKGIMAVDDLNDLAVAVNQQATETLSETNAEEFMAGYDKYNLDNLKAIDQAYDELKDSEAYRLNGDRKDGTHNDSPLSGSDIRLDALDRVAEQRIHEYKTAEVQAQMAEDRGIGYGR